MISFLLGLVEENDSMFDLKKALFIILKYRDSDGYNKFVAPEIRSDVSLEDMIEILHESFSGLENLDSEVKSFLDGGFRNSDLFASYVEPVDGEETWFAKLINKINLLRVRD